MKKPEEPIYVTQPSLPDLEEFIPYLEQIWENKWLTNNGPMHKQLEAELASYLGVPYICLFANGTLALLTALQALEVKGEVITTPYSFVATSHALVWNNLKPVFVDIDPLYGNLDPKKIEDAITHDTQAILPVHVYGNPCNHVEIKKIANKHKLKLIYDAAHAFGVEENNKSILNYGDLSVLSFHATKVFNTFEGGAIICKDQKTKQHIDDLKNFGFRGETTVILPGINAKMNEVQAAMGLLQLKGFEQNIKGRENITNSYRSGLSNVKGIRYLNDIKGVKHNYAYFPIFIEEAYPISRDELYNLLRENNIFARRYFYPLISDFDTYKGLESSKAENLKVAKELANKVICLPIYPDLELDTVEKITRLISKL